jgi:hypothetical protein
MKYASHPQGSEYARGTTSCPGSRSAADPNDEREEHWERLPFSIFVVPALRLPLWAVRRASP